MNKYLTLTFFLITIFAFSQDNFIEYKKDNFSISYPENWKLDTSGQMNSKFIIFSPHTEGDAFNENVNLIVQDLTGQNLNLQSYTELSVKQVSSMVPNAKLIESTQIGSHQEIIWSGFVANNNLKFKQIYYVIDSKAYVLTFTAHETTFDDYIKVGGKILNSFQLN